MTTRDIFARAQRGEVDLKKICCQCEKVKKNNIGLYKPCLACELKSHRKGSKYTGKEKI